jgi:hypothetical protein
MCGGLHSTITGTRRHGSPKRIRSTTKMKTCGSRHLDERGVQCPRKRYPGGQCWKQPNILSELDILFAQQVHRPEEHNSALRFRAFVPELLDLDSLMSQPCSHFGDTVFQSVYRELETVFQKPLQPILVKTCSNVDFSDNTWSPVGVRSEISRRICSSGDSTNDDLSSCSTDSASTQMSHSATNL